MAKKFKPAHRKVNDMWLKVKKSTFISLIIVCSIFSAGIGAALDFNFTRLHYETKISELYDEITTLEDQIAYMKENPLIVEVIVEPEEEEIAEEVEETAADPVEEVGETASAAVTATVVEQETHFTNNPTSLSDDEYEILAKLLYCEARGMTWEGQVYTCSAILNLSDYSGRSIWNMAHDSNTFSPASFVDTVTPSQTQYDVINHVLSGNRVADICWFRTGHYHNFGTPVCEVDGHYFSKP